MQSREMMHEWNIIPQRVFPKSLSPVTKNYLVVEAQSRLPLEIAFQGLLGDTFQPLIGSKPSHAIMILFW